MAIHLIGSKMGGALLFSIQSKDFELTWRDSEASSAELNKGASGYLKVKPLAANLNLDVNGADGEQLGPLNMPLLFEERAYQIALRSKTGKAVSIRHPDPAITSQLSAEFDSTLFCGTINFHANVGFSRFALVVGQAAVAEFTVEVYPSKLEYKSDYQQMLAETEDYVAGLIFEYLRSTFNLASGELQEQSSLLQWLLLLKAYIGKLEQSLLYLDANPLRGLRADSQMTNFAKVKKADSVVKKSLLRQQGRGQLSEKIVGIPARDAIRAGRNLPTLDTVEHRWIASQLKRIHMQLMAIGAVHDKAPASERNTRVASDLQEFRKRVNRLSNLNFLQSCSDNVPSNFASMQLISATGYAECYRACIILNRGLVLQNNPVELALKDISTLYEYWTYLTTVFMLAGLTGSVVPVAQLVSSTGAGLELNLAKGKKVSLPLHQPGRTLEVTYNAFFNNGSQIVQRPDILISIKDENWPVINLLLDAKYRVKRDAEYLKKFGAPGPPNDAINVLHRYRDAILERASFKGEMPKRSVVQAAALFPCELDDSANYNNAVLWKSIGTVGIGAIPLLPGNTDWLRAWLQNNLQHGAWALADRFVDSSASMRRVHMRQMASESVLIGTLRNPGTKEHFEWIASNRCYYAPYSEAHTRQLKAAFVAIYSPASLRGKGAVTHVAQVRDIEIVERAKIQTPWSSSRQSGNVVVYKLDAMEELSKPILNERSDGRGERFSVNRWSTKLALERAKNLNELLLETEQEWRLYEELNARAISFRLMPGRIRDAGSDEDHWRTWFELNDGIRLRAAGAAGIKVLKNSEVVYLGDNSLPSWLTDGPASLT